MRLRDATPDDIAILEHWDRQPHVIEAGGEDDCLVMRLERDGWASSQDRF